jgi:hypothetical protein
MGSKKRTPLTKASSEQPSPETRSPEAQVQESCLGASKGDGDMP